MIAYCVQFYFENRTVEHVGIRPYGKSHSIFVLTIESSISDLFDTRDLPSLYNAMDKFLVVAVEICDTIGLLHGIISSRKTQSLMLILILLRSLIYDEIIMANETF